MIPVVKRLCPGADATDFAELSAQAEEIGRENLDEDQLVRLRDLAKIRNKAGDRSIDELLLPLDSAVSGLAAGSSR